MTTSETLTPFRKITNSIIMLKKMFRNTFFAMEILTLRNFEINFIIIYIYVIYSRHFGRIFVLSIPVLIQRPLPVSADYFN